MTHWGRLRIFYHVATAKSFTAAGHQLNIAQSSISRQIIDLEYRLKTRLFERHPRSITLTPQGEILLEQVKVMVEAIENACIQIQSEKTSPVGVLKLIAPMGFSELCLFPVLSKFLSQYPGISLSLMADDDPTEAEISSMDAMIHASKSNRPGIKQYLIANFHFKMFASQTYLEKNGTPTSVSELDQHKLISLGHPKGHPMIHLNWHLTTGMPSGEIRKPYIAVNLSSARPFLAENHFGITSLPRELVDPKQSNLVEVLPDVKGPKIEMYLSYLKRVESLKRVEVLREFLLDTFAHMRQKSEIRNQKSEISKAAPR
ncbi:MAG: LysR family transcriptional regulator [Pseudomonadota bacterium]